MGKLIVIDGPDGVGKKTQFDLLLTKLNQTSKKITTFDFPQYSQNIYGKLVGECLKGIHGNFVKLSPYLASLPYAGDRLLAKDKILHALQTGDVLCNRYIESNLAFQSTKLKTLEEKNKFIKFIEELEHNAHGLPKADLVIYLAVPIDIAGQLIKEKEKREYLDNQGEKDLHEKNITYQIEVAKTYRELAQQHSNWALIECYENDNLLSREKIHEKIMFEVEKIFQNPKTLPIQI